MRAHGGGELDQHIQGMMWSIRSCGSESQQRLEQCRTVGQTCALFIDHLDLFAFKHRNVGVLTNTIETTMLDDQ